VLRGIPDGFFRDMVDRGDEDRRQVRGNADGIDGQPQPGAGADASRERRQRRGKAQLMQEARIDGVREPAHVVHHLRRQFARSAQRGQSVGLAEGALRGRELERERRQLLRGGVAQLAR
jgi:hypothetical protein